ncbi:MAG: hypothetical protein HRU14_08240, partial [Planctomycetes bacterium]|nr:hypothetical protein [Planctomycetota bacterium]
MRSIATTLALVIPGLFLLTVADAVADPSERHQQIAAIARGAAPVTDAQIPDLAHGAAMLARQPVAFVENQGQWDGTFSHVATFGPMAVFLEDRGWAFTLTEYSEKARHPGDPLADRGAPDVEPERGVAVRMRFCNGAKAATPVPEERLPGVHHYFFGNDPTRWKSNVPLHGSVRMEHLYPGIDVRARGSDGHFEYDLLVEPGADLDRVQVEVAGADGLHLDADGTLVMATALGPVRQPVPKTWQVTATGAQQEITCNYVLLDHERFGFAAPERDRDLALVVDPGLIWSTFLGDGGDDRPLALGLDTSGAVTVAGLTSSLAFPTTPGVFDTTHNGGGTSTIGGDAFVTRLDPSGGALLWSSFLGGGGGDVSFALGVDPSGAVTVTGLTDSSDFPVTVGAFDTFYNGDYDAFVTRLDPSGVTVLWSTFLGGGGQDYGSALGIDASGSVTVAGTANSSNFPTTTGAFDTTHGGGQDGFVSRLDESGSALLWSTFLGSGGTHEGVFAIGLDASEAVTVTGYTDSSDYPTTPGAFDTTYNGSGGFLNAIGDAFATRVAPNGSTLLWSTFLGGAGGDLG